MNVTALLAHPDDELFCAGTLARHVEQGDRVVLHTAFVDERVNEMQAACAVLGVEVFGYSYFDEYEFAWSKRFVEYFDKLIAAVPPDILISHRTQDPNHSHANLGRIARTLTRRNLWSLWEIDQTLTGGLEPDAPSPNLLVNITGQIDKKRAAIRCYASQCERYPGLERAVIGRDEVNGWQFRMTEEPRYAEAFRVVKAVL